MTNESRINPEKAGGSDAVLRAMMLLALMLILVVGGYAIFWRRPASSPPPRAQDPAMLLAQIVAQPTAGLAEMPSWGTLYVLADELPSRPGWQTRYQAARALAHLGSDSVPWADYREMLDEHRQFCNFRTQLKDGQVVVEEAAARQIMLGALKDLAGWHVKHSRITPGKQLLAVYSAVDELAKNSPIAELKKQAEATAATFYR